MAPGAEAEITVSPRICEMPLIEETDVVVPANWKVIMDNSIEGYHFDLSGPVHKTISKLTEFKKYKLAAHGNWWTYIGPPKAGIGAPMESRSRARPGKPIGSSTSVFGRIRPSIAFHSPISAAPS